MVVIIGGGGIEGVGVAVEIVVAVVIVEAMVDAESHQSQWL